MSPVVSVLMPVYNGERYIRDSIESMLNQSFDDFELLIVNDGSTDRTYEIVQSYSDPRIFHIFYKSNRGKVCALNTGLDLCKGKYIALMDCDDVSLPTRLERQVKFMDNNPEIGICGSWMQTIGLNEGELWKYPISDNDIKQTLLFANPIGNSTAVIRKTIVDNNKMYFKSFPSEDYDYWARISEYTSFANIPEVLVYYRLHDSQVTKKYKANLNVMAQFVMKFQIERLGIVPTEKELAIHAKIGRGILNGEIDYVCQTAIWLCKLLEKNRDVDYYHEPYFSDYLARKYYLVCNKNSGHGLKIWFLFRKYNFHRSKEISYAENLKLFVKCCLRHRSSV